MYRKFFLESCLRSEILIEGGFVVNDTNHPQFSEFKELIIKKRVSLTEYIQKTIQSAFVFNTPAVHNCHGWKLGQYLAMNKAIISMPFVNSLPEDMEHGKNIHFVSDISGLDEAVTKLLNDDDYRKELEIGAALQKPVSILEKLKHQLFLLLGRYTIKVVLNQDEKQYYPFDCIEVISNFISPQQSKNSQKEKFIISAGRIAPVKQFNHLIAAWSKIANELTDWAVHIYGEGEAHLKKQLQNQIQKDQVPRIELKAATQDLDKRMQEGSIYAMTSATECFPMVLLEAQAAGMAIISYDCPNGPRNIITNEVNGLLVENQNIDAFAKELKQLILNPSQQKEIQLKAQENISKFLDKSIMNKWNELLLKIIKNA